MKFKKNLNKKQKMIIGFTSLTLITGGSYGYIQMNKAKEQQRLEESIQELYQVPGREKIFINGKIYPVRTKNLSVSPEQGELSEIRVEDKAYVEKGAPLFSCKNKEQIKEIESLKLQITAKSNEKLNAPDEETKIAINDELRQLYAQVAELNKTAYTTVYAPFSGNVYMNKSEDDKSYVMTLETTDLYVKGQVNERDSYKISLGQDIEFTAIATNNKYIGKIIDIGNRPYTGDDLGQDMGADSGMTKYEVNMSIDNQENLKSGLNVQIVALSVSTDKKIPNVSVIQEGNKYYVFKVKNDIAKKVEVKVKEKKTDYYLIENGINEGDDIIKDATTREIKDGDTVYTGSHRQ